MTVIANHLKKRGDLQQLEFVDNEFDAYACNVLGHGLGFNRALSSLTINHNDIGDRGAIALCRGLSLNQSLKTINLSYCGIGPDAAEAIGYGIATCAWEEVFLNGNELANDGAIAVCKGLAGNDRLTRIELRDNYIDTFAEDDEVNCVDFIQQLTQIVAMNITFKYEAMKTTNRTHACQPPSSPVCLSLFVSLSPIHPPITRAHAHLPAPSRTRTRTHTRAPRPRSLCVCKRGERNAA